MSYTFKKIINLFLPCLRRCRYCLSKEDLTVDHVLPKTKGGKDNPKNLQLLCRRCNFYKGIYTEDEIKRLFDWFEQVQKDRAINK